MFRMLLTTTKTAPGSARLRASRSSTIIIGRDSMGQRRQSIMSMRDAATNLSASFRGVVTSVSSFENGSISAPRNNSSIGARNTAVRFLSSTTAEDESASETTATTPTESFSICRRSKIRSVAIIAHVDHGKTTLVDRLLQASKANSVAADERLMDSGDLEKERGITITSKVTRIMHDMVINVADTPGHSDFSGEVDRFLSLSDGFILVVDAAEGPKSQTKYVLSRALALGLKPIVVMNKCDRSDAIGKIDTGETEHKLIELFETLNATEEQKNFLTLYASARLGWITEDPLTALELADTGLTDPNEHGMKKLLNYIVSEIPEPTCRYYGGEVENDAKDESFFASDKFSMAAVTVGYDQYLGRTCTGRIVSGSIDVGDSVVVKKRSGDSITSFTPPSEISGVFIHEGISRVPLNSRAYAGDIVTLTGVPSSLAVGDTLTGSSYPVENPIITPPLAPPILAMMFGSNDGPLAGTEGAQASSAKIRDRLIAETDNNVTLKVEVAPGDAEKTIVYARGELQLGILIETMRREGFEMVISPPTILTKTDPKTGKTLEPYEEVVVDVDAEYSGTVIGALTGDRRGVVVEMSESTSDGKTQIIFHVPSRGLLGFNNEIASATKGSAVVNHLYLEDREYQPLGMGLIKGKLVNTELGKATTYALNTLQARGTLFVEPGDMLYPGMVIGENSKPGDMEVNAVRAKQVSNIRTKVVDEKAYLTPPKKMALEELIGYMDTDEIIEVTPKSIRLRKKLLDAGERERAAKAKSKQLKAEKQKKMGAR